MASIPKGTTFDSADTPSIGESLRAIAKPLASLKITVTVFALSLFLILVGSLAQARTDVWLVVSQYFRCWVAWVDVKDLFPPAFFPSLIDYNWDGLAIRRFPYPGGWTLGLIATINLFAAHGLKFKIQAKGQRLWAGLAVLVAGIALTTVVVSGGMNSDGFQAEHILSYTAIWRIFQVLSLGCLGWLGWKSLQLAQSRFTRFCTALTCVALAMVTVMTAPLTDASMRILWQLMKAEFASLVLLAACWLLFRKRSGVVLLHAGVAVLMLSEVQVGLTVSENRFQIAEGQKSDHVFDIREREIVVIDNNGPEAKVVSIPEDRFLAAWKADDPADRIIRDDSLPFDLEIEEYFRNSELRSLKPDESPAASAGVGLSVTAEERKAATGLDSKSDSSTAFVRLRDKETGKSLGSWMLAMRLDRLQPVLVDGKLYDIAMRFKRSYKPYTVELLDVKKRDYLGTSTPRDYSSYIRLQDPERGVDREVRIWMNNPLRYRGETIYQTGYDVDPQNGTEYSSMQVVTNRAWMLPYMACMIVFTGLAVQFGMALVRYQNRRMKSVEQSTVESATQPEQNRRALVVSLAVAVVVAGYFGSKFRVPKVKDGKPDLYAFGKIPVVKGGRQQPISSVALNRVRVLTTGKTMFHRELRESELEEDWETAAAQIADAVPGLAVTDLQKWWDSTPAGERGVGELVDFIAGGASFSEDEIYSMLSARTISSAYTRSPITRKAPAMWWMLDVITQRPEAERHRIFRIDEPQLVAALDLPKRKGALYSFAEVMGHFRELDDQVDAAAKLFREDKPRMTRFQRQLLNLATAVSRVTQLRDVFTPLPEQPGPHRTLMAIVPYRDILKRMGDVGDSSLVLPVPRPGGDKTGRWDSIALASLKNQVLEFAAARNCQSIDSLVDAMMEQLRSEYGTTLQDVEALVVTLKERLAQDPTVAKDILELASRLRFQMPEEQFRLRELLRGVGSAPSVDPEQIHKSLPHDRLYELAIAEELMMSTERLSREMKEEIGTVFRTAQPTVGQIEALMKKATREVAESLFIDEEIAAGPGEHTDSLIAVLGAWRDGDFEDFNKRSQEHVKAMAATEIADVQATRTGFEAWFNHSAPAYYCAAMYLIAFALACVSLLVWETALRRVVFTMVLVTFGFHTFALIGRIYISGRPPVTNLYSSAVFIGWGAVLLALIFEYINKRGIGNLVSTAAGAATLVIAYILGGRGDTFEVLQAVLDTQFWLATHVVSITLGYSATFLAGMFGIVFILKGVLSKSLVSSDRKELSRMIYGTLCFAILFSFIGTILGGLWADDSWGRFWGWDTKENGAMMIVIWNAIVLHARWDNMVKDRGMAVLSVGGNIVTAWSWFGVNELGAGLHSYGFTEGALLALLVFAVSQLTIIGVGLLPKDLWGSFRKEEAAA